MDAAVAEPAAVTGATPVRQLGLPAPALAIAIVAIAFALRVYRLPELPPGLFGDEGWNLADILEMQATGRFPLFFPNNTGREPVFIYLQAAMAAILGVTPFAGRLTAAFVGTVTVALLYRMGRALFGPDSWAPLVSAAVLTFTLYHLLLSRVGLRAISLAPFAIASFIFLWEAFCVGRWRSFLLGGLFLGLTLQTYLAARVVPLVPLLVLVVALLRRWPLPSGFWRKSIAAVILATAVAAPLLILVIQNPFAFLGRTESVAVLAIGGMSEQLANIRAVAGMFIIEGSDDLRHNLPGRPMYDPAFGVVFLTGLAVVVIAAIGPLRRRLNFPPAWEPQAVLTLAWFGAMLLPTLLSGAAPHFLRSLGLAPAAALFSGFGAEAARRRLPVTWRPFLAAAVILLLSLGALSTVRDYFYRWSQTPDLPYAFDTHMLALADYLRVQMQDHPISLDAPLWWNGTLRYAFALHDLPLPGFYDLEHVFAERDQPAIFRPGMEYILLIKSGQKQERLPPWLRDGQGLPLFFPGGALSFQLADSLEAVSGLAFRPPVPAGASFAGVIAPVQASVPEGPAIPGQPFSVVLRWQLLQPSLADYHLSLRALDSQKRPWAVLDDRLGGPTFPTSDWRAGESVYTAHSLTLAPDAPPGHYTLVLTVYAPGPPSKTLQLETSAGPRGDLLEIGEVAVTAPAPSALAAMRPAAPLDHRWTGLRLFGYSLDPPAAQAGEPFDLHLFWESAGATVATAVRLALEDASGAVVASVVQPPLSGAYPFARWSAGDAFHDVHRLLLPARAAAGGSRLSITPLGADGTALGESLSVSGPEIRTRARRFEAPAGLKPLGAEIGDLASILGYTAPDQLSAGSWPVTLAWRVVGETERSYAVTLQLLDANGRLVAQHDGPPAEGAALTSSWLAGEVVVDPRALSLTALAPGRYTLIAAMYDPITGERLPVRQDGRTGDHVVVASYDAP